jgi:uncharacterized protein YuzE
MSEFHPDSLSFRLDGIDEPLGSSYDEQADILYLWRGDAPRPAISIASVQGHLIRLDQETGEIVGFTIFDFSTEFPAPGESLQLEMPSIRIGSGDTATEASVLELVPA